MTHDLSRLGPAELLTGCRAVQRDRSHEVYCHELFRRAIAENSDACWAAVHQQYEKLVYSWAIEFANGAAGVGDTSLEEIVQDTFFGFWRSYDKNKLANAGEFSSLLKYLKSCCWSSVQHARRRNQKVTILALDEQNDGDLASSGATPEQQVLQETEALAFWSVVESFCHSDRERAIVRLRFVNDWKPRDIVQRRPDLAGDEREIFKLLRNVKDRLERSGALRQFYEEVST